MALVKLTKGYFAKVDDSDLPLVSNYKWCAAKIGGHTYAIGRINGKNTYMHRFILGVSDRKIDIDHADRDGLNNTRKNLRIATRSQNSANSIGRHHKRSSKFKGVYFDSDSNRWRAEIVCENTRYKLGKFKLEEQAAVAYNIAAEELFGEFARKNNIDESCNNIVFNKQKSNKKMGRRMPQKKDFGPMIKDFELNSFLL